MNAAWSRSMQIHASCAARDGVGVLLLGRAGAGKSDLVLRLIDRGFVLVADDRVEIADGMAAAPSALAGLLELRGIGILRLPFLARARLALAVRLGVPEARLPRPAHHAVPGNAHLPLVTIDPAGASAAQRVAVALDCVLGRADLAVGAFATARAMPSEMGA
jgi:HPr kinase/phosphorylase